MAYRTFDSAHCPYSKGKAWWISFLAALPFFYQICLMGYVDILLHSKIIHLSLMLNQINCLYIADFFLSIIFIIIIGFLLDRHYAKIILLITLVALVASMALLYLSSNFISVAVSYTVFIISAVITFLISMRVIANWFFSKRLGLVVGLLSGISTLLWLLSSFYLQGLDHIGFQLAFFVALGVGISIFLLTVFCFANHAADKAAFEKVHLPMLKHFRVAFGSRQNWLASIYLLFISLPAVILTSIWGKFYLENVHYLSQNYSVQFLTLSGLGTVFGAIMIGRLSDRIQLRKPLMVICAILAFCLILSIMYLSNLSVTTLFILFFFLNFVAAGAVLVYVILIESNFLTVAATSLSLALLLLTVGRKIFTYIFQKLMYLQIHAVVGQHAYRSFDQSHFSFTMLLLPASYLVAFVVAYLVRETHALQKK